MAVSKLLQRRPLRVHDSMVRAACTVHRAVWQRDAMLVLQLRLKCSVKLASRV